MKKNDYYKVTTILDLKGSVRTSKIGQRTVCVPFLVPHSVIINRKRRMLVSTVIGILTILLVVLTVIIYLFIKIVLWVSIPLSLLLCVICVSIIWVYILRSMRAKGYYTCTQILMEDRVVPPSNSSSTVDATGMLGSHARYRKPKIREHRFLQNAHSILVSTKSTKSYESEVSTTESEDDSEDASVTDPNLSRSFTLPADFVRRRAHSQGRPLHSKHLKRTSLCKMDSTRVYGTIRKRAATCLETSAPLSRNRCHGSRALEKGDVYIGNFRNSTIVPRERFNRFS